MVVYHTTQKHTRVSIDKVCRIDLSFYEIQLQRITFSVAKTIYHFKNSLRADDEYVTWICRRLIHHYLATPFLNRRSVMYRL